MICHILEKKGKVRNIGGYIIRETKEHEDVSDIKLTNTKYGIDKIDIALMEMEANNLRSPSNSQKSYHFVISLAVGETLTPKQFQHAEQRYIDAFGLTDCQRISATHNNTENLHRHVVVATASCEDRKNRRPKFDKAKAMRVSRELEQEFGLSVDAGASRNAKLYDSFKVERERKKADRAIKLDELRSKHGKHAHALRELYDSQLGELVIMPRSKTRKESISALRYDREITHLARRTQQRAEREEIYERFRPETWGSFLKRKAAEGHPEAIRVLRKRQRASQRPDLEVAPENQHPGVANDRDNAEAGR